MDWTKVGFDWNRVRAFLVSADEGSFSAAARALGMSQPTIGRQVAALEEELGVALFERAGSALRLTAAGADLAEHARAMGEAATKLSIVATGQSLELEGDVCITASDLISARLLPPILLGLRRDHPGIRVEIVASNDVRDLLRREADIAVRHVRPDQPELVAKKIADDVAHPYATPEYLARLGDPRSIAELGRADFIAFDRSERMIEYLRALGLSLTQANFPLACENSVVQWELARGGAGICFLMERIGDADPLLTRAVPDFPPLPVPIWLAAHRELLTSRRIRVVFDRLAEGLAS
ncbi:MAG: LysR family transcriptional regulator [Sandaracinaceae bacterium]